MPLSTAAPVLEANIKNAFLRARNDGINEGVQSDAIITMLATQISTAIHGYMIQALVSTKDMSATGQTDLPASGITSAEGQGIGTGNLL